jgi:hypothetical protein
MANHPSSLGLATGAVMTVTLPLVVGGVEDSWIYPKGSNDGYLCGYADTDPPQMPLAEDQNMIQALPPKRSDQPFSHMDS